MLTLLLLEGSDRTCEPYAWAGGIDHPTRVGMGSVVVSCQHLGTLGTYLSYTSLGAVTSLSATLLMELCVSWVLKRSQRRPVPHTRSV